MKVSICTPYYADVTAEYTNSLMKMVIFTMKARIIYNGIETAPDLRLFMKKSTILPEARNRLVYDALEWGANYLLWIDADHHFPEHSLLRLLSLNLPAVGVNYPKRSVPTSPTALGLDGELVWTTEELVRSGVVAEVAALGLGLCLIDMNVIHTLSAEKTHLGQPLPFFALEMFPNGLEHHGEDYFFFKRTRKAGFPIHVDHELSWSVGHMHQRALTNADAVADREVYQRAQPSTIEEP